MENLKGGAHCHWGNAWSHGALAGVFFILYWRTHFNFTGMCGPFICTHFPMMPSGHTAILLLSENRFVHFFNDGHSLILLRNNQCCCLSNEIAQFPDILSPWPSYPHLLHHFPAVYKPALSPSFSQVKSLLCLEHISLISMLPLCLIAVFTGCT